jgi:hypothetical protein
MMRHTVEQIQKKSRMTESILKKGRGAWRIKLDWTMTSVPGRSFIGRDSGIDPGGVIALVGAIHSYPITFARIVR